METKVLAALWFALLIGAVAGSDMCLILLIAISVGWLICDDHKNQVL